MKSIVVAFTATFIIQITTAGAGLLSARVLGPVGKGELAAVVLWPSFLASVGSIGIFEATTYVTSGNHGHAIKSVLTSGFALVFGLALSLVSIGYVLLPRILAGYPAGVVVVARQYLLFIPLNYATLLLMATLLGRMRLVSWNLLRTVVHVCSALGLVALTVTGRASVSGYAMAMLLANVVTLCLAALIVARNGWIGWAPDPHAAICLLSYGWKSHLGSVASLFNLRLDQMLMSIIMEPANLGFYTVAVTLSALPALAPVTLAGIAFPHIANLDSEDLKLKVWGRFVRFGLVLSLVTSGVLLWQMSWVIRTVFSMAYLPATPAARILTLAVMPLSCNVLLAAGYRALNRPLVPSHAELIGLGSTAVLLIVLLPRYGTIGAASASLVAYSVTCAYMLWSVRRTTGFALASLIRPTRDDHAYIAEEICALVARLTRFHATTPSKGRIARW